MSHAIVREQSSSAERDHDKSDRHDKGDTTKAALAGLNQQSADRDHDRDRGSDDRGKDDSGEDRN
jgi:hypothetical protein